jgi:hypothetical protein
MEERRTIQINPDFFKLSRGNRKSRRNDPNKPIKIKTEKPKTNVSTLRKNILNMIRKRQEYKTPVDPVQKFKSEFDDSLDFLSSLQKHKKEPNNQTIRHLSPRPHSHLSEHEIPLQNIQASQSSPIFMKPNYGCLKNGTLPTYRVWKNETQKQKPINPVATKNYLVSLVSPVSPIYPKISSIDQYESKLKSNIQELSRIEQLKPVNNKARCRRKRITKRREFTIGKLKTQPIISVLVSNKTLRAERSLLSQELKQTSIQEVKKYLLKRGFIKVGTSCPTDVLRKMYESAKLIGGEIQNHNSENMLHNYFNEEHL